MGSKLDRDRHSREGIKEAPLGAARAVGAVMIFHTVPLEEITVTCLSTSNYLTSAHIDGRCLHPMVNQRSANVAGTAIKAMPARTETADANG